MTDFDIGDAVRIDGEFTDPDGVLTDPATLELKARPPGYAGVNEIQRLVGNATDGTLRLSFDSQGPTAAIDFDASVGEIQVALEALSNIAPGDIVVSGGPLGSFPVLIEFTGALGLANRPLLVVDTASLTGGTVVATVDREGAAPSTVTHTWPPDATIVKDETGKFHAIVTPDKAGTWDYRWKATGVAAGAEPGQFSVRPEFLGDGWRPSVADVAAVIRARTKEAGGLDGGEIGTFTTDTRPTAAQVETAIGQAMSDVKLAIRGVEIPTRYHESARAVVAVRAAGKAELGYFANDDRVQAALDRDYEAQVKELGTALQWWWF